MSPEIYDATSLSDAELSNLKNRPSLTIVDIYENQIKDLYKIKHPKIAKEEDFEEFASKKGLGDKAGVWVYFPWNHTLLHCVDAEDLYAIRTNRNKLLINEAEQANLYDAIVGVAGMSVGAGMATGLAYSGISRHIKIADFDFIDSSNLNRLRVPLTQVGRPKVEVAAQSIYEIDPFAEVETYAKGLDDDNIDTFFDEPRLKVVIDEIDDFKMKVHMRLKAKEYRVPLLMFTSLGDNILIDVERYDLDANTGIFNGLLGELTDEIVNNPEISTEDARRYAVQLVGQQYVPTRALESLLEMGKTLVGRPQLYSTIAVDGGLAVYVVKQIILGNSIKSGRYFVQFGELFGLGNDGMVPDDIRQSVIERLLGRGSR